MSIPTAMKAGRGLFCQADQEFIKAKPELWNEDIGV